VRPHIEYLISVLGELGFFGKEMHLHCNSDFIKILLLVLKLVVKRL